MPAGTGLAGPSFGGTDWGERPEVVGAVVRAADGYRLVSGRWPVSGAELGEFARRELAAAEELRLSGWAQVGVRHVEL